jgi:MFS family permease
MLSGVAATFPVLLISRLIMGLSEGGILPICQSLLVAESSEKRRGLNMGVMQNVGSNFFGSFLAPIVLVAIAQAYGWRTGFYVAAVPGLLCALLVMFLIREPKMTTAVSTAAQQRESWLALLHYRNIWVCIAVSIVMVAWMCSAGCSCRSPIRHCVNLDDTVASYLAKLAGGSRGGIRYRTGMSDRIGRRPVVIVSRHRHSRPARGAVFRRSPWVLGALVFVGWAAVAFPGFSWRPFRRRPSRPPAGGNRRGCGGRSWVGERACAGRTRRGPARHAMAHVHHGGCAAAGTFSRSSCLRPRR